MLAQIYLFLPCRRDVCRDSTKSVVRRSIQFSRQFLFAFLVFIHFTGCLSHSPGWKYHSENEEIEKDWPNLCKNGLRQSPIDLTKQSTKVSRGVEPLAFINYNRSVMTNVTNDGHTVVLKLEEEKFVAVAAGGLHSYYILNSIHFHWGGSEHTFANKRLPMEVHLVHYNGKYGDINEAKDKARGLAVIAVLFYESLEDNPSLSPLTSLMNSTIDDANESAVLERTFSPAELLPPDRSLFFRYDGSLTTPPCSETVVWTVMYRTISVSKKQLEMFKSIKSAEGSDIKSNYRKVHPYEGRKVFFVNTTTLFSVFENVESGTSGAVRLGVTAATTFLVCWVYFWF